MDTHHLDTHSLDTVDLCIGWNAFTLKQARRPPLDSAVQVMRSRQTLAVVPYLRWTENVSLRSHNI